MDYRASEEQQLDKLNVLLDFVLMKFSWLKKGVERVVNYFNHREEYMHKNRSVKKYSIFIQLLRSLELIKKTCFCSFGQCYDTVGHVRKGLWG